MRVVSFRNDVNVIARTKDFLGRLHIRVELCFKFIKAMDGLIS